MPTSVLSAKDLTLDLLIRYGFQLPGVPRGTIAQAWSVAETLRAWCEIGGGSTPAPAADEIRARRNPVPRRA